MVYNSFEVGFTETSLSQLVNFHIKALNIYNHTRAEQTPFYELVNTEPLNDGSGR